MRILNRPMFKYGGPIKEGVMHGMRNGGRTIAGGHQVGIPMGNRTGFQSPYSANYNLIDWKGANRPYRPLNITNISEVGSGTSNATKLQRARNLLKSSKFSERGLYEAIKKYGPKALSGIKSGVGWGFQKFPLVTTGIAGEYFTRPRDVDKLVYEQEDYGPWEGRFRKILDPTYNKKWMKAAEKYYKDKKLAAGKDKDKDKDKFIPSDKPEHLGLQSYTDPDKAKKLAKEKQNERLKSYLDMMGYDSAKKTALSDALIDASAIVQQGTEEAGSLKEADWGKMINKAIQTTSRRLDKPGQIREAVGLMSVKAAIEKDLEDPQVKKLRALKIEESEKILKGLSIGELIPGMLKSSGKKRADAEVMKNVMSVKEPDIIATIVGKKDDLQDIKDASDFTTIEDYIVNEYKGKEGIYIIDNVVVQIDANGVPDRLY